MKKLIEIFNACVCSVSIEQNQHKDYYETIERWLEGNENHYKGNVTPEVLKEIIKRDNCIVIQAYPNTPIGFHCVYHYDLEQAINEMHKLIFEP